MKQLQDFSYNLLLYLINLYWDINPLHVTLPKLTFLSRWQFVQIQERKIHVSSILGYIFL